MLNPTAPPCEPGAYVTTLGRVVVVLDVGAEVCVRVGEKSREWWSHKRWRATMVGATREDTVGVRR